MKNTKLLLILNLIFLYKSDEYYEEILVEKVKSYQRKKCDFLYIKYVAKDDGKYVIIFPNEAFIKEIKGEIHQDIKYKENKDYYYRIYFKDFKKGDYVKIKYPAYGVRKSEDVNIRIGKMDSYTIINDKYQFIFTKEFTDCSKPIYFLLANNNPYPHLDEGYFFGLVHSGEFSTSYKKNNYTDERELLIDNYQNIFI